MRRALTLLLLLALQATPAPAQDHVDRYEAMYGRPVDVALIDLLQSAGEYLRRSVRTKGRFELMGRGEYALRDGFGNYAVIEPMPDVSIEWNQNHRTWLGREIEIVGVVGSSTSMSSGSSVTIQFWEFLGPPEQRPDDGKVVPLTMLEALVTKPGSQDGRTVRVVGQYRGGNLFGDLPAKSARSSDDWVIKDELFAVWVTGKRPRGDGFRFDTDEKRDTGKWIEVVGDAVTINGVVYVRARRVALSAEPPRPGATVQAAPPPSPRPKRPPIVVFSLPLDGDGVNPDGRFVVQFSKDMDEESFAGKVFLRYADGVRPGDRGFVGLRLEYDGGRRALTVDPGDRLQIGREIQLVLLPGIQDLDGLQLSPRVENTTPDPIDVLRFYVGG